MEYRKLISFGKSSFVVSLPKIWVNKQKLKKGDTLYLDEKDNNLILQPRLSKEVEVEKEAVINIDGKDFRRIQREIVSAYLNNHKSIILIGDEIKNKAPKIQNFIQNLIALEIMEQNSKKIVAKDFLNIDDISLDQIIRKMDVITRSMMEDCKNTFTEDNNENIYHRDNDINKFRFLIFKLVWYGMEKPLYIFKKFNLTQMELLNLWWLAFSIESIADCVKRIARYMSKTKLTAKNQKEFKKLLSYVEKNYIEMMKSYHTKNPEIAHKILEKREEITQQCDDFYLKNKSAPYIGYLMHNTKSLLVNIHIIGRIIYQGMPG